MKHTIWGAMGLYIAIVVALLAGWVMNLIAVINMAGADEITTLFVIRIVGVAVVPLGGVMGWF